MRRWIVALLVAVLSSSAVSVEAASSPEEALNLYRNAVEARGFRIERQGFLFETLDGKPLLAHNVDCLFNPASVTKLATSSVALERLGPEFRFTTEFYTNGSLNPELGDLTGDLIVVGSGDPSFVTQNAFFIARELRLRGIRHITGNLVVKGALYCNFSMDRRAAGAVLKSAFDVEKWNPSIESAFGIYRVQTGSDSFESVTVDGSVIVDDQRATSSLTPLFTLRSMPLIKILKQLNNYSNNWMAHVIGARVGGPVSIERRIEERLRVGPEYIRFQTTSGLGDNNLRPLDVVSLLIDLRSTLDEQHFGPENLMPVAGIDPGTLEDRFLMGGYNGAVVAKTGTLRGVSVLAGYMYTRNRGVVAFAIMNEGGTPATFRKLQDYLVTEVFDVCGGPAPLPYRRPTGFGELAGAFIERAPGNIPESQATDLEGGN